MNQRTKHNLTAIGLICFVATAEVWAGTHKPENTESKVTGTVSTRGINAANYPKLAKLSSTEAAKIATDKVSGDILSVGLESEDAYLVYSIQVANAKTGMHELIVDAGNGQVLADQTKGLKTDDDEDGESED